MPLGCWEANAFFQQDMAEIWLLMGPLKLFCCSPHTVCYLGTISLQKSPFYLNQLVLELCKIKKELLFITLLQKGLYVCLLKSKTSAPQFHLPICIRQNAMWKRDLLPASPPPHFQFICPKFNE